MIFENDLEIRIFQIIFENIPKNPKASLNFEQLRSIPKFY